MENSELLKSIAETFVPSSEIETRISVFQAALQEADIDAAIVKQNVDLYYYSGTVQDGYLYVPAEGDPLFMVYRSVDRARIESPVRSIVPLPSLGKMGDILKREGYEEPSRLGLELDVIPAAFYVKLGKVFKGSEIRDVSSFIRLQRRIKSPFEIEQQRSAGRMCARIAEKAGEVLREGVMEIEAQGLLEAEARKLGHIGPVRMRSYNQEMFYGHLISGPEAVLPSSMDAPTGGMGVSAAYGQGPGRKKLRRGEAINVDIICNRNGYLADQTRCFCIGEPGKAFRETYAAVREIHETLLSMMKPGLPTRALYEKSFAMASAMGYGDVFMGFPESRPKFIGHGVGLEADEFPFITESGDERLEPGMVVAIEPKIFLKDYGVVGIEDMLLITGDSAESITIAPRDLVVLPVS